MARFRFVNPSAISKSLRCSICLEPFFQPVRTPCGHVFCKECLEGWREKKPSCPLDQQPLPAGSHQVDFVLAELLSEYEILCPNECSWTGIQRDWPAHRSLCPNERVSCSNPGCKQVLPRKELVKHQEVCPHLDTNKSVITLNVGGRKFQTLRTTLMKHENSYFAKLFQGHTQAYFDNESNYFIDRNGDLFDYILEWMRTGVLEVPQIVSVERLKREMAFYELSFPPQEPAYRVVRIGKTDSPTRTRRAPTSSQSSAFTGFASSTPTFGAPSPASTSTFFGPSVVPTAPSLSFPTQNDEAETLRSLLNQQAQDGYYPTKETLSWLLNNGRLRDYSSERYVALFRREL